MNRITTLLTVLFFTLACSGSGYSELAEEECAIPADATACDKCYMETCTTQCKECVDDETCYKCTTEDGIDEAQCVSNEKVGLLLTCVLTADCATACTGEPPPDPSKPPRIGKGRKGGKGGKSKGGDGKAGKGGGGGDEGGDDGGGGKAGKKHKGG